MQIFGIIIAAIFGAILGSYATLFAYRLPRGESCFGRYFGRKSHCPNCGTTILTRDLIPLFNWIITFGKCRNCQARIPRTHLFIELACTILVVLCYLKFSFSEQFILASLICVVCVILLVTDFTHKTFPYQILIFLLIAGLSNRILLDRTIIDVVFSAAYGAVFAAIFYYVFYKKTSGLFATEKHSLDYTKFILISSVCLKQLEFLLYFVVVMAIFTAILFFKADKQSKSSFAYCLVVPFLWLILK